MPIPVPKKGESNIEFISRCVSDNNMKKDYSKKDQRLGVCYSSLRKHRKNIVEKGTTEPISITLLKDSSDKELLIVHKQLGFSRKTIFEKAALDMRQKWMNELTTKIEKERKGKVVLGEGNLKAFVMVVGGYPDKEDTKREQPFSEKAGKVLGKYLQILGIERESVYVTNMAKTSPKGTVTDEFVDADLDYINEELDIVDPKIVLTLGDMASQRFLNTEKSISEVRGRAYVRGGMVIFPTYHPAKLLNNLKIQRPTFDDVTSMKTFMSNLFGHKVW